MTSGRGDGDGDFVMVEALCGGGSSIAAAPDALAKSLGHVARDVVVPEGRSSAFTTLISTFFLLRLSSLSAL